MQVFKNHVIIYIIHPANVLDNNCSIVIVWPFKGHLLVFSPRVWLIWGIILPPYRELTFIQFSRSLADSSVVLCLSEILLLSSYIVSLYNML